MFLILSGIVIQNKGTRMKTNLTEEVYHQLTDYIEEKHLINGVVNPEIGKLIDKEVRKWGEKIIKELKRNSIAMNYDEIVVRLSIALAIMEDNLPPNSK